MLSDTQKLQIAINYIAHLEKELNKADERYMTDKKKLTYFKKTDSTNVLRNLWDSSKDFWYRFYNKRPQLDTNRGVFLEEVTEFVSEVDLIVSDPDNTVALKNMLEEAADVIVTIEMCLLAAGISWEEFEAAITNVCLKNDAKTHETHAIDPKNGKITRKSKLNEYSTELS